MANTALSELQKKQDIKAEEYRTKSAWATDKKDWVYVSIPAENALGEKHDTMGLNTHYYEAGETYLVPLEVANFLKERLAVYARACVRVLQPKRDYAAENAVAMGSTAPRGVVRAVDPSTLKD